MESCIYLAGCRRPNGNLNTCGYGLINAIWGDRILVQALDVALAIPLLLVTCLLDGKLTAATQS
jgi:hypothetical protein